MGGIPLLGDSGHSFVDQREDRASETPARVTAAPDTCRGSRVSPSQAEAMTMARTGSSMAVIPTRVALMRRSAPTTSANGTIVPRTTIQAMRAHVGRWLAERWPRRETLSSTRAVGKFHQGATKDQKSVAKKKPQADSEIASRRRTPRSASRMYAA